MFYYYFHARIILLIPNLESSIEGLLIMKQPNQHVVKSFDKMKFDTFIKAALQDAHTIRIVLSENILEPSYFKKTKWAYLENSISAIEKIDGDGANYGNKVSRLYLKNDKALLQYFNNIHCWNDFGKSDETTGLRIELVEFLSNENVFAWIISDYADYFNYYGWYECWKPV